MSLTLVYAEGTDHHAPAVHVVAGNASAHPETPRRFRAIYAGVSVQIFDGPEPTPQNTEFRNAAPGQEQFSFFVEALRNNWHRFCIISHTHTMQEELLVALFL